MKENRAEVFPKALYPDTFVTDFSFPILQQSNLQTCLLIQAVCHFSNVLQKPIKYYTTGG